MNGDWEGWLKFFLKAVAQLSKEATDTARKIIDLQKEDRDKLAHSQNALKVLDKLYSAPGTTLKDIAKTANVSSSTAGRIAAEMEDKGILVEITGQGRNKKYLYQRYLKLF